MLNLNTIQALAIDMDGVLWRGDTPLPGLANFFKFLDRRELPFVLATNNASKTPVQYQQKLAGFGVAIKPEQVMTSSLATAAYLKDEFKNGARVYVIGGDGLRQAMRDVGFTVVEDASQPAEAVVAGIDFGLTYDKLKYATLLIQRGARFVGSNGDVTFPSEEGYYPGAGSILAAVQAATKVKPVVIGKPESFMFEIAMRKMGSQAEHTVMIGDRLETDILGGQRAGLKTILVTTGVDNAHTIEQKKIRPDMISAGLGELIDMWEKQSDISPA
jgi:4-nitrophenyl phosphatase